MARWLGAGLGGQTVAIDRRSADIWLDREEYHLVVSLSSLLIRRVSDSC